MHICFVLYKYGWPMGGFYAYFRELFLHLVQRGIDVSVACYRNPEIPIPKEAIRTTAVSRPAGQRMQYLAANVSPVIDPNGEALRRGIMRAKVPVDLVHSFHDEGCAVAAMRAARQLGCPFAYTPIGNLRYARLRLARQAGSTQDRARQRYRSYAIAAREKQLTLVCSRASRLIVPSNYLGRMMVSYGASESRIKRVPFAVDTDRFKPGARHPDGGSPLVVYLGRIDLYQKAVDEAVKAFASHAPTYHASLCIIGDGPDREPIARLTEDLGIAQMTRFLGKLSYGEVPAALSKADIMLLPFKSTDGHTGEGFPRVLAESLASGVPIVSTDVQPIDEVVENGKVGLLAAPGDLEGLRDNLSLLLGSASTRWKMGRRARTIAVGRYSFERVTSSLLELYSELCSR